MDGLMFTVGVVALASVLIGLARLGAWFIDRREEYATKAIRDAAATARASYEICHLAADREITDREYSVAMLDLDYDDEEPLAATFEWTALNEETYQRFLESEQAALKRGDLMGAAQYAELADRVGYVAGQGNEP